jgi:Holliday junction resolvase RusA-like endonuclease
MVINLPLDFKPVGWKRPAGRNIRYDKQVPDKVAFAAVALKRLIELYPREMAERRGLPLFGDNPVTVNITFVLKGKRPDANSVPDIDNLVKFTLDALQSEMLTGVVWEDDRQVCEISARKMRGEEDKITVLICD